jgi:hypothetical protein
MKTDIQKPECFAIEVGEFTVEDKGFLNVSVMCLIVRSVNKVTCPN